MTGAARLDVRRVRGHVQMHGSSQADAILHLDNSRALRDAANRAVVRASRPETMNVVGLALREDKKIVDKITKGAKLHS